LGLKQSLAKLEQLLAEVENLLKLAPPEPSMQTLTQDLKPAAEWAGSASAVISQWSSPGLELPFRHRFIVCPNQADRRARRGRFDDRLDAERDVARPVHPRQLDLDRRAPSVVLRDKAIKPLLAAAQELRPSRGAQNPRALDVHYDAIRAAMQGVFQELGLAA
jgi:hypothetical protein